MTGPTHAVIGLAATIALLKAGIVSITPVELLVMLAGALAPDIDGDGAITRPGTLLRRWLPPSAAKLANSISGVISAAIRACFGHRGFFHWPIVGLLLVGLGAACGGRLLFWFGCGYCSHIFADYCTKGGIPLWGPLSLKRYYCFGIVVGSWREQALFVVLLAYVMFFGWDLLPEVTRQALLDLSAQWKL